MIKLRNILVLLGLCAAVHGATIQQSVLTTNKLTIGDGITNDALVLKLNVAPGTNMVFVTNSTLITLNASTPAGSGDDVWVSGVDVTNPNFSNTVSIAWSNTGTNVFASLLAVYQPTNATLTALSTNTITGTGRIALESEIPSIAGLLDEAAASALYQATNANLTTLSTAIPCEFGFACSDETTAMRVYYDATYTGTLPQVQRLAQPELITADAGETEIAVGAAETWETLTFTSFTPTRKGVVYLRLISNDTAGNGVAYFDTLTRSY